MYQIKLIGKGIFSISDTTHRERKQNNVKLIFFEIHIFKATYLEKGKSRAALIAPLTAFDEIPQVVVFTANSEQVMWLLYAVNYEKGGRMNLPQSGGALGGCADITALPLLTEEPNFTFLGLGCRMKSAVGPADLMMGISGNDLEKVHRHVGDMAKPIQMLNKQSSAG